MRVWEQAETFVTSPPTLSTGSIAWTSPLYCLYFHFNDYCQCIFSHKATKLCMRTWIYVGNNKTNTFHFKTIYRYLKSFFICCMIPYILLIFLGACVCVCVRMISSFLPALHFVSSPSPFSSLAPLPRRRPPQCKQLSSRTFESPSRSSSPSLQGGGARGGETTRG